MPLSGPQGAGGPLAGAPEEQGLLAGLDPGGAEGHPASEAKVRAGGGLRLMNTLHQGSSVCVSIFTVLIIIVDESS